MSEQLKYTPQYNPEDESDVPNISGLSPRQNISIEEAAQRAVAESEEWLLARKTNRHSSDGDTRQELEALGFTIMGEHDDLFYKVQPPTGWTKSTSGFWTTINDADGNERISQFFKGAWYDRDAFLSIK